MLRKADNNYVSDLKLGPEKVDAHKPALQVQRVPTGGSIICHLMQVAFTNASDCM